LTPIATERVEHHSGIGSVRPYRIVLGFPRVACGVWRATTPWIKDFPPAADRDCPRISLIFAARDEEEKLATALATSQLSINPNLEIIAVQ